MKSSAPYTLGGPTSLEMVGLDELVRLQAFDAARRLGIPGRFVGLVEMLETRLSARVQLREAVCGSRVRVHGHLRVRADGELTVGDDVVFFGGILPTHIRCLARSTLRIGDGCSFNYGSFLEASGPGIEIGPACLVASRVLIEDVTESATGRVVIEDHVWLANGVTVRPGVRIGHGTAVAAGSVVAEDVPADCLAVGTPARHFPLSALGA